LGYGISPNTYYGLGDVNVTNGTSFVEGTSSLDDVSNQHFKHVPLAGNNDINLNHYGGFRHFFDNEDVDVDVDFTLFH
jgi:hypothetical protein